MDRALQIQVTGSKAQMIAHQLALKAHRATSPERREKLSRLSDRFLALADRAQSMTLAALAEAEGQE